MIRERTLLAPPTVSKVFKDLSEDGKLLPLLSEAV
jgi:hypothetical protein